MSAETQPIIQSSSQDMSPEIGKLAEALAKAQGAMYPALKDNSNPFFKTKYADLSSVWEAARKPLSEHGLSVVQTTEGETTSVTVVTLLLHSSGQWIKGKLKMHPTKPDPQGIGSAITYARRYALSAMVGVAPEDDDAEAAVRGQGIQKTSSVEMPKRKSEPSPIEEISDPFWTKVFDGKKYLWASSKFFSKEFLKKLGMIESKTTERFFILYSETVEAALQDTKKSMEAIHA